MQVKHYVQGGVEVIDVIRAFGLNFVLGNAVKYICRCGRKGDEECAINDLKKAVDYLNSEIEYLEKHHTRNEDLSALAARERT